MAADQTLVPRVPRLQDLTANVEKMKMKDERTYIGEDNVVFVHRSKKRRRLSAQEKDQVCCIVQNVYVYCSKFVCIPQKKRQKKMEEDLRDKRQANRECLRWEICYLVKNGGNPDENSPIKPGDFLLSCLFMM